MTRSVSINPDQLLPVDIVLAPSWWYKNAAITFDESFFYHPIRRVEVEKHMERVLFERWGKFGLGQHHLAACFFISKMLGQMHSV